MKNFLKDNSTALLLYGGIALVVILYLLNMDRVHAAVDKTVNGDWKADSEDPEKIDVDKVLKKGSYGPEVMALQKFLVSKGADLGNYGATGDGVDGIFGKVTESELQRLFGVVSVSIRGLDKLQRANEQNAVGSIPRTGGTLSPGQNTGIAGAIRPAYIRPAVNVVRSV